MIWLRKANGARNTRAKCTRSLRVEHTVSALSTHLLGININARHRPMENKDWVTVIGAG